MKDNRQENQYKSKIRVYFWVIFSLMVLCFQLLVNHDMKAGGWYSVVMNNSLRLRRVNQMQEKFYLDNQTFASYEELEQFSQDHHHILFSTDGYYKQYELKIISKENTTLTLAQGQNNPDDSYQVPDIITGIKYNPETKSFISITCLVNKNVSDLAISNPTEAIIFNQSKIKCGKDVHRFDPSDKFNQLKFEFFYN